MTTSDRQVVSAAVEHIRNDNQLQRLSSVLNDMYGTNRRCLTCDHFNEAQDRCVKYGMKPPSRVIAFGCPEWVDVVPF